jgi:hypothetical protein
MKKIIATIILGSCLMISQAYADQLLSIGKNVTGGPIYDDRFPISSVNDGKFNDTPYDINSEKYSYWITPNNTLGAFIIDLGSVDKVTYFEIQNTRNRIYGDRGGEDFKIYLSLDNTIYTAAVNGTLNQITIAWGAAYPLQSFNLATPINARYVKFDLLNYYGSSGGINELSVYGSPVPVPPTVLLFGSGFVGLIGLRMFRRG